MVCEAFSPPSPFSISGVHLAKSSSAHPPTSVVDVPSFNSHVMIPVGFSSLLILSLYIEIFPSIYVTVKKPSIYALKVSVGTVPFSWVTPESKKAI